LALRPPPIMPPVCRTKSTGVAYVASRRASPGMQPPQPVSPITRKVKGRVVWSVRRTSRRESGTPSARGV